MMMMSEKEKEKKAVIIVTSLFEKNRFEPQSPTCALLLAKLGFMPNFKFIDQYMPQGHPSEVLHCNYNGKIGPKNKFGYNF